MNSLFLRVMTPLQELFNGEVEKVSIETTSEGLTFYPGHVNYLGIIETGGCEITTANQEVIDLVLFNGLVEVINGNECQILIGEAYFTKDIDVAHEQKHLKELELKQASQMEKSGDAQLNMEIQRTLSKIQYRTK